MERADRELLADSLNARNAKEEAQDALWGNRDQPQTLAPPSSPSSDRANEPPPHKPNLMDILGTFIKECTDWSKRVDARGGLLTVDFEYLNKSLALIKYLATQIYHYNSPGNRGEITLLHSLIANNIPWNFLSGDLRLKHFNEIFKHTEFRQHFIFYYYCDMDSVIYNAKSFRDHSFFHVTLKPCNEYLLDYLLQYQDVTDLLKRFPNRVNYVYRGEGDDFPSPTDLNSRQINSHEPVVTLCDDEAESSNDSTQFDHRHKPSQKKIPAATKIDEALKDVKAAFSQAKSETLPSDEEMKNLTKGMKTANRAYTNPNWEDITDLLEKGDQYQNSSTPAWKVFGIALIALAGALAIILGAMIIAVSLGAISSGFLSPLGAVGAKAGAGIATAGLVTLVVEIGLFCESCDTDRIDEVARENRASPCYSY
jgi:hypothetical protein